MDIENEFPSDYDDDPSEAARMAAEYPLEWYDWAATLSDWHAQVQRADLLIAAARTGGMPEWMIGQLLKNPDFFADCMRATARTIAYSARGHNVETSDLPLPAWAYRRWW